MTTHTEHHNNAHAIRQAADSIGHGNPDWNQTDLDQIDRTAEQAAYWADRNPDNTAASRLYYAIARIADDPGFSTAAAAQNANTLYEAILIITDKES